MEIVCNLRVIFAEIKTKDRTFRQEDFAERVGLSKAALSALVNGHTLPTLPVAYRIARALGRPVEEIWEPKDGAMENAYVPTGSAEGD